MTGFTSANRLLSKFRAQPETEASVPFSVTLGWYVRKGAAPGIRGLFYGLRVRCKVPFFVGKGCTIAYARSLKVGKFVVLGRGCVINAYSLNGITLGDRVTIRENAWIQCSSHPSNPGSGLTVGSGTYVGPSAIIGVGGPVSIGSNCQIGSGVTLIAENHEIGDDGRPSATDVTRLGITIGDGCWIGHRAAVLDGVVLGDNCVVGAGAVVTRSFPPGSTIVGVPARAVATKS
jgi:acetyltransferase-like isoleucine patch superfamily enzyme